MSSMTDALIAAGLVDAAVGSLRFFFFFRGTEAL